MSGPMQLNEEAHQGEVLFMHYCNQCHPGGEAGTGTAITNKPVPQVAMRLQIRQGVLGIMPKFPETEISDADVDRILAYVSALESRRH